MDVGKQFEDIINSNFSKRDTFMMKLNARRESKEHNLSLLPPEMIKSDTEGKYVRIKGNNGFLHMWDGGSYIEHQTGDNMGTVEALDVTNVGNGPLTEEQLHTHISNWEKKFFSENKD